MNTKTLVKINDVPIQVVEGNAQTLIPLKPICEAIGVDFDSQRQKLRDDDFLNSVAVLNTATGGDGKQYEMLCLPYEFVFGWLFTINPKNVKEEAREAVSRYRIECYRALYRHFTEQTDYLQEKQDLIDEKVDRYQEIQIEFKTAKDRLARAKEELNRARAFSFDDWKAKALQGKLEFSEFQTV